MTICARGGEEGVKGGARASRTSVSTAERGGRRSLLPTPAWRGSRASSLADRSYALLSRNPPFVYGTRFASEIAPCLRESLSDGPFSASFGASCLRESLPEGPYSQCFAARGLRESLSNGHFCRTLERRVCGHALRWPISQHFGAPCLHESQLLNPERPRLRAQMAPFPVARDSVLRHKKRAALRHAAFSCTLCSHLRMFGGSLPASVFEGDGDGRSE